MEKRKIYITIDEDIDDNTFAMLLQSSVLLLRSFAPKDTGNLAYNATKYRMSSPDVGIIYVDPRIAPYMVYTEEPWRRGRNPNEGWFKTSAELISRHIQETLQGVARND